MQATLLADVARIERPWRRVRPTSVAAYAYLRDSGVLAQRRWLVLTAVAALKNRTGRWPTGCEVQRYLAWRGLIPNDGNPNHVKPRLTELADGWDVKVVHVDEYGRKTMATKHVHCDVLRRGKKRRSQVTGITVLTWCVRSR